MPLIFRPYSPDNRPCATRYRPAGFTLVELVVVVGIIALLMSILLPAVTKAREWSKRTGCTSNVRQIVLACNLHAAADKNGVYIYTPDIGSDDLRPLYPKYLTNPSVAACPSTQNRINKVPADLANNAASAQADTGGHSYEIVAWYTGGETFPDGQYFATETIKRVRNVKNSSNTLLLWDADDSGENNWPDASNNHGAAGVNIGFTDGHAEWVTPGRHLLEIYMDSAMGVVSTTTAARYGVKKVGSTWSY
jgi:prepilin-type N-terminal cleavage/methylation domain-containing protein/prepilin-type processing-associated H-X9-DG protein